MGVGRCFDNARDPIRKTENTAFRFILFTTCVQISLGYLVDHGPYLWKLAGIAYRRG